MRWYKIVVGSTTFDATGDPGALNIELDIPVSVQHIASSGAFARVWGVPFQTLLNAKSFNRQTIQVFGGMQQGLPLANPAQQGLLVQGTVFPALGNWVGTDMTLDFYIAAPLGETNQAHPANIIHNWKQGQPLSQAIRNAISTAFPKFTLKINISPSLVLAYDDTGFYQTLGQYASYLVNISRGIMKSSTYAGVQVSVQGTDIIVSDGTVPENNITRVNFQDLIGQPIWTGVNTVQFKTVMRGDINIGQQVMLPPALATLTPNSGSAIGGANTNQIQGKFLVQRQRHTGNFRQPEWTSWCTTVDCVQAAAAA